MAMQKGSSFSAKPWLFVNYISNQKSGLRVGYTIPKFVGNAVTRNRFKRWIKEALRTSDRDTKNTEVDINFVFKRRKREFYKELKFIEVKNAVKYSVSKIKKHTQNLAT